MFVLGIGYVCTEFGSEGVCFSTGLGLFSIESGWAGPYLYRETTVLLLE